MTSNSLSAGRAGRLFYFESVFNHKSETMNFRKLLIINSCFKVLIRKPV